MKLIMVLFLLVLAVRLLKIAWFESVAGLILMTPVIAFLAGKFVPLTAPVYFAILVGLYGLLAALTFSKTRPAPNEVQEGLLMGLFCLAFLVFFGLCMRWPDFISIGERLRDYAMLSSVLQSPVELKEPWMSGYPLNYYAYWYRLGHMLSKVLSLETWDTYHQLQSFTYALFFTSIFTLLWRHYSFKVSTALFCSLFVAFGSNVQGIISYLTKENGWWGPSRVVTGAINEFPVWSFLLGDLHPHYVNLPLIPYFACAALIIFKSAPLRWPQLAIALGFCSIPFVWIYNGNAWEVPVWGILGAIFFSFAWILTASNALIPALITAGCATAAFLVVRFTASWGIQPWSVKAIALIVLSPIAGAYLYSMRSYLKELRFADAVQPRTLCLLGIVIVVNLALYLSSRNILPAEYPFTIVKDPVVRTTIAEMFRHWGFPLVVIGFLLTRGAPLVEKCAALVLYALSYLLYVDAFPILLVMLTLNALRVIREGKSLVSKQGISLEWLVMETIGFASFVLILIPEFVFLDDPYGGEIERMNTIFKMYSSAWFMIHVFAFYLAARAYAERREPQPHDQWVVYAGQAALFAVFTSFFWRTIPMRDSQDSIVDPRARGLSQIEREFPGSAQTIKTLHGLEPGIVLEGQGNPYSYTTHISTLAGRDSYLGWANHVNLITRDYGEVARREKFTETFYKEQNCAAKLSQLAADPVKIKYIVVGPLEKQRYPDLATSDFSCFNKKLEEREYRVYSP